MSKLPARLMLSMLLIIAGAGIACRKEKLYVTLDKGEPWRITSFLWRSDRTAEFSGYLLSFKKRDVLEVSKGSTVITGSWTQTTISGSEYLIISLPESDTTLSKLNETWGISEYTPGGLTLSQRSPNMDKHMRMDH